MSQENLEIVRRLYADPRGLTAAPPDHVAPDAEFDFSSVYPDSPVVTGVDGLRRFRDSGPWGGAPIHFEPERYFEVDHERVLAFVRVTATGSESGVPVEHRAAHEFTIRNKLLVRFKAYADRDEALEAVGLTE